METIVEILEGLPGFTQGLTHAWCWLVIVSDFTSQLETLLRSLVQVYHECLWAMTEAISLHIHEWKELLRAKDCSEVTGQETEAGGKRVVWEAKAISTAMTTISTEGFLRGNECVINGC